MHNRILQQKISDNSWALASVGFGVPRYLQLGLLTFVALMCAWSPSAEAQETSSAAVDFQRDVRPILVDNCFQCHGPDPGTREADLRLDTEEGAFATRPQGSVIVPGDFPASLLYQRIAHENQRRRMPPVVSNKTLTDAQIDVMRRWIEEGASWDQHWSFKPIERPEVPAVTNEAWVRNSLDHFVLARLESDGLTPNPEADKRTLARRLALDLTGLPLASETLERFLNDHSEEAYEKLVDQLLESEHWGEHRARYWLDAARYADTHGIHIDNYREMYPYRDWVIQAFNENKPFNEFTIEQVAGDLLPDPSLDQLIASGFQRNNITTNEGGAIVEEYEAVYAKDRAETTGSVFLGLTVGCATCHDHKFDPIHQNDYYGMQAIFAGLQYGHRRLRGQQNDAWTAQVKPTAKKLAALRGQLEAQRLKHGLRPALETIHTEHFQPVLAQSVRMKIKATADGQPASLYEFEVWSTDQQNVALASNRAQPSASSFALANQSRHFENLTDGLTDNRQSDPWVAKTVGPAWIRVDLAQVAIIERIVWHRGPSMLADYEIEVLPPGEPTRVEWQRLAHTEDRLPRLDDIRPATDVSLKSLSPAQTENLLLLIATVRDQTTELARLSAGPQVYAASFGAEPPPTWLLRRGNPMQRQEEVAPAIPALLGEIGLQPGSAEPNRRLELVKHLTHRHHPLTARVLVNRIWQHHFGTGLVSTPSDLGRMGESPSHPRLLDWLALEFIAQGWSLKKLHRLIVNSRTYQQSSRPRSQALQVDAETRLLWRFPPRRLEAEAIRDSILFVNAKLNLKMGGPGFDFFNQRGGLSDYSHRETFEEDGWRRMIYAHKVRMQAVDIFGAFDCPDAGQMSPRRSRSITPLQALSLMNSPFVNRQAGFLAQRVKAEGGDNSPAQIDYAFRLVYARAPEKSEKKALLHLAGQHGLEQVCRVLFNSSEFVFIQ